MTDGFTKSAHATQWIPVKNLSIVWSQAQRPLNERHVDKIAENMDPDLFDDLVVTLPNGNGIYHVVDGQHRRAAVQKLYGEDEKVPCRVVNATDPARAAAIFEKINTGRRKPSALERFNVRVTAGFKDEVEIHKTATWLGYRISGSHEDGCIRAVAALTNVYKKYGLDVLKDTLTTIKGTWNDDHHAVDGPIIEGFGALIVEHRGHLDFKRLRDQTAKKFTPGRLLGHAKGEQEIAGGTLGQAVCRALIRQYDTGIRTGKLGG